MIFYGRIWFVIFEGDNKEGGGGGDKNENIEDGIEKIEHNRMEYLAPPAFGFGYGPYGGYGHGHGHGNVGGYSCVPVYPEQMHFHLHAPAPQMFSDENPNACSVM